MNDIKHYWGLKDVRESAQKLMNRKGYEMVSIENFPEFKEGKFNWFQRLFNLHKNDSTIYTSDKFVGNWCYITFKYKLLNEVVYVMDIRYEVVDC